METVVLVMVCLSPWAFGAVEPLFEFALYVGVSLLLVLWGVRALLEGEVTWARCPIALCLAGLFLLGLWQLTPLPPNGLHTLAPGTAELYDRLLPTTPEVLSNGEDWTTPLPPAGRTFSLYPTVTRWAAIRLLAVFLLFVVVRNNVAAPASYRRLAVAALINGGLLSLFALVQCFSSPRNTVYWSYPTAGQVFGPFVCRNHFPFYVNMSLGLGLGLLAASSAGGGRRRRSRSGSRHETLIEHVLRLVHEQLRNPRGLYIAGALALMLCANLFSLSRGGVLAALGAALATAGLALRGRVRPRQLVGTLLIVGAALGLGLWFGLGPIEERFATLSGGQALDNRLPLWSRAMRIAADFPLWGTGYGTFPYVEPTRRTVDPGQEVVYENAHNEYLEMLVEGGLPALLLTLLVAGFAVIQACRAVRRHAGTPIGALAWGGLFALLTAVLHSLGDFGMHIPAITVLATVLAAQLDSLAGHDTGTATNDDGVLRLGGLAPAAGLATALALGLVLCGVGWETQSAHASLAAAARNRDTSDAALARESLALLEAAAARHPDRAEICIALARAHHRRFEKAHKGLARTDAVADLAQLVVGSAVAPGLPALCNWRLAADARVSARGDAEDPIADHLIPTLRAYLRARDLCPVLAEPHAALATYRDRGLASSDTRDAYLARAKELAPGDAQTWYLCGVQEIATDPVRARASWRRCLELSEKLLPDVLRGCLPSSTQQEILDKVLPDSPTLLLTAAYKLYPAPEDVAAREPFLTRALALLEERDGPLDAPDLATRARIFAGLEKVTEATAAYREALRRQPRNVEWRYEFAVFLLEHEQPGAARREVLTVLAQRPAHAAARRLQQEVARQLAEGDATPLRDSDDD